MNTVAKPVRVIIALVVAVLTVGVVYLAGQSTRTAAPMPVNGDVLGRYTGESVQSYEARARATVTELDSTEPAFALVTFDSPRSIHDAAGIADRLNVPRISAVVLNMSAPVEVPEPAGGRNREQVFGDALKRDLAAQFLLDHGEKHPIEGLVIWAPTRTIKRLTLSPDARYVEALPQDAAWGRFGIQPVYRQDSEWSAQSTLTGADSLPEAGDQR